MNCIEAQNLLDSYLDADLSPRDKQVVDSHLAKCSKCQNDIDDARQTRELLSSLSYQAPSEDFEQKVFENVRAHYTKKSIINKSNNKFVTGFASAIAVSLVIWVTSVVFFVPADVSQFQVITVAMNQVQTIRLMLDSENDVELVTLSLALPDNIRLKGYENKSKLVWKTSLTKGDNILSLPIKAIADGQGDLIAQVQYGNKLRKFRISIKTFKEGIQNDVFFELMPPTTLV